jgi:hypothetical protein
MKNIILLIASFMIMSCSIGQRIHNWSYTNEWYYENNNRYQVYKTVYGRKYIIVIDQDELVLRRKYLKLN